MNSQRLMSSYHEAPLSCGSDEHALERRGLFVRHERVPHPHPHVAGPGTATPPTTGRHSMADM